MTVSAPYERGGADTPTNRVWQTRFRHGQTRLFVRAHSVKSLTVKCSVLLPGPFVRVLTQPSRMSC